MPRSGYLRDRLTPRTCPKNAYGFRTGGACAPDKIGGRVAYVLNDLAAWADQGAQTDTTDPDGGRVCAAHRHAPEFVGQLA